MQKKNKWWSEGVNIKRSEVKRSEDGFEVPGEHVEKDSADLIMEVESVASFEQTEVIDVTGVTVATEELEEDVL